MDEEVSVVSQGMEEILILLVLVKFDYLVLKEVSARSFPELYRWNRKRVKGTEILHSPMDAESPLRYRSPAHIPLRH